MKAEVGQRYRHNKTRGVYVVTDVVLDCHWQSLYVVYHDANGSSFGRSHVEFCDGRFTALTDSDGGEQ